MSHFAKVNSDGVVLDVINAEQDFIDAIPSEEGVSWIQTSYNTHGAVHSNGQTPLRKNYAGIGFTYDSSRDAFIPPQPYPSWQLNEDTCLWGSPIPYPSDNNKYEWSESLQQWTLISSEEV